MSLVRNDRGVGHISTLSVYLVAAAGAGDDDAPLPSGYAAHRAAAGAGEVPVLLVHPLLAASGDAPAHRPPDLLHEPCVLPAPLLQIPGKHPEQRPQHQNTRRKTDDAVYRRLALPQEHIDEVQQDRRPQHGQPQLIHTVAPVHETRQRVAYALQKVHSTVPLRPAAMPQVL